LNSRTCGSPSGLLQISTSREAGQLSASFVSAASLLNRSEYGTASASFAEPVDGDVVRFFFYREVLHCRSFGAVITAVTTLITSVEDTCRRAPPGGSSM
jgi:hypothetical protein